MERFLPVLSGSLREILVNLYNEYPEDNIAKEILVADNFVSIYLKNKDTVPEICPLFEETIKKLLKNEVIMLSGRYGEEFEVSFLPADRDPVYTDDGKWARTNRQTGRPGKIFQKLIAKEFKQYEWEQFINRFKATMCCSTNFEIVEGEQITHWYNSYNYYRCSGTLGNSCMKYNECSDFFKVYEDNAKMLISTKEGKLTGRAIVWEVDGVTLLDRVYTCFDYLENCFIGYAKDHGWWIRQNNSLLDDGSNQFWYTPDDDYSTPTDKEFIIKLKHHYDKFPYVDSFRYYDTVNNIISTNALYHCYLSHTDGTFNDEDGETWICDSCGESFYSFTGDCPDELHYSERSDAYFCDDCCWWCEYLEDYISESDSQVRVYFDSDENYEIVPESWIDERAHQYEYHNGYYYDLNYFKFVKNKITGTLEPVLKD